VTWADVDLDESTAAWSLRREVEAGVRKES